MSIYLEAINTYYPLHGKSIFLAGGITDCWNWQERVGSELMRSKVFDFVINPRREEFDILDKTQKPIQTKWEYDHLDASTHVMFWFTADTLQPITLFELGKMISTDKTIYVGCDPQYARQLDVVEQLRLSRPDIKVWDSLDNMVDFIISDIDSSL